MAGRAWAPSPSRWTAAAAMAARRWPPASTPRARSSLWSRPDLTLEPGRDPIEMHGRRAARQQVLAEIEAGCVSRRRADVDADADADRLQPLAGTAGVVGMQPAGDGQRRAQRAFGAVRLVHRRTPERHHRIADILVDRPAFMLDDGAE